MNKKLANGDVVKIEEVLIHTAKKTVFKVRVIKSSDKDRIGMSKPVNEIDFK